MKKRTRLPLIHCAPPRPASDLFPR